MLNTGVLARLANSVRSLTIDAVQKANSGHPGLPLGCAELGAILYGDILRHYPLEPKWSARDRVVLSAGHGSMWLYSLLHLSGYDLPLEELKNFRQLHSKTPGHPEVTHTKGVEVTTGPLGSGLASAVGLAIGESRLSAYFGLGEHNPLFENYTYVLAGDGCMMEGVSSEACSLAGHLKLNRLIVFYDSNQITIDGSTQVSFTENVGKRFEAYNWQVLYVNPYDFAELKATILQAKAENEKPSLIVMKTLIGKGAPNKQGTHQVHGSPLGEEEVKLVKKNMGFPVDEKFYVPQDVKDFMAGLLKEHERVYQQWCSDFAAWSAKHPSLRQDWDNLWSQQLPRVTWSDYQDLAPSLATRNINSLLMQDIARSTPNFFGGSADLASSNLTDIKGDDVYSPANPLGRNIRFGIREHAMGAIVNGLSLYAPWRNYGATFLVFSDYMRPAIRLSAIQCLPVVWIFTHDSFHLGEDGPTHQPVEHLNSLRLIPNLKVARPADLEENQLAWEIALETKTSPFAFLLSRQNVPTRLTKPLNWKQQARCGAYVLLEAPQAEFTILSSGADVHVALEVAKEFSGKVQLISVWCKDLWDQSPQQKATMIKGKVIIFESASYTGYSDEQRYIGLKRFGESGKAQQLAEYLGVNGQRLREELSK